MVGSEETIGRKTKGWVLLTAVLALGCDPYFSIQRIATFEGEVTETCLQAAAESLGEGATFVKQVHPYGPPDFREFSVAKAANIAATASRSRI